MSLLDKIVPISYLKANAAEIIKNISDSDSPLIITQNGEAKLVVQDIKSYEETQETLALLKVLALSKKQFSEGDYSDFNTGIDEIIK